MINEFLRTMVNLFKDLDKNFKWVVSASGYILVSNVFIFFLIDDNKNISYIHSLLFLNIVIILLVGSYLMVIYQQNKLTMKYFDTIIKATETVVAQDYYNHDIEEPLIKDNTIINSLEEFHPSETNPKQTIKLTKPFITWRVEELEKLLKWAESVDEYTFACKIRDRIIELNKV